MLLLLLLAVGAQAPAAGPPHDPALYPVVAAAYRTGDRERAIQEILKWSSLDISAAVRKLCEDGVRSERTSFDKDVVQAPVEIDVPTVEAAALMHVEAGLLVLQTRGSAGAERQFAAAASLVEYLHDQKAQRLRLQATLRRYRVTDDEPDRLLPVALKRALTVEPKIGQRDFYVAVAAGMLALGFPEAALPLTEKARAAAPRDAQVLLLSACVKEGLALAAKVTARAADAGRLREEAEALFRATLAADPTQTEARLRLGSVLLAAERAREAEPLLRQAVDEGREKPQLYLALLLLGRASEMQEKPREGAAFYRRALDAWPESQAARLALAQSLDVAGGPAAAHPLVMASLQDSTKAARERDPWWSYPFGPRGLAKAVLERLWQATLGRSFGS